MSSWVWASATCRGTSHEKSGVRLQDALSCTSIITPKNNFFIGVVSDGAGSANYGGQGATLACRTIFSSARFYLRDAQSLPSNSTVEYWVDKARDRIYLAAEKRGLTSRDFAATLICVLTDGFETLIIHIGDGCAVLKDEIRNQWIAPSWPEQGEFASTTFFITDEIDLHLRITRVTEPISSIAIFSDGLERLALDFASQIPFDGFLDAMVKPLMKSSLPGKNSILSDMLKNYLNSELINSRTDDDKSLIIALKNES